ncbi:MAG: Gldg family protein [Calditrichia bacterium]
MNVNWNIVKAIFRRDLRLYFTNPTGYVFITLFIFLSAVAAFWQARFFANNLANLNQLNQLFPLILMFFIPALTMGIWADERKQGTDELLLTLPGTDLEIVLGKFLAAVGIYTASLALSVSHVFVLFWLGSPDIGLMFGNYFGYWLIGVAFIAIGMFASLFSKNATISFVLGALFCAFFVFIGAFGGIFGDGLRDFLSPLGVTGHFGDFARGVVSFSGLFYFLSLTALMIYFNVVFIGRRLWPNEADGMKMSMHHGIRAAALVVGLISLNAVIGRMDVRLDTTAEQLHSLSGETPQLLGEIPDDRPVLIQAYISKDVPQQLVQTRANLVDFLTEIDSEGGSKVQVLIHDTEPYTQEARDAREKFGIVPREVPDPGSARASINQVFMGVAFTCGAEEEVIPFFEPGLPTEYELVRSIRTVAKTARKKVGVVVTKADVFGGFDFQTMNTKPSWQVVAELKKQYEVVRIAPAAAITEEVDGLVVPMPSSMAQDEMDNVMNFIETGVPTLLLVDPLPVVDLSLSPSEKSDGNKNPFQQQQGPPPKPKGNIEAFMNKLGVNWNKTQIVWDAYNPHPDFSNLPPEVVFIGRGNQNPETFNTDQPASAKLQELVLMFPGFINKASGSDIDFQPLVRSGFKSATQEYGRMVQRSFFGTQLNTRGLPHRPNTVDYTFAASLTRAASSDSGAAAVKPIKALVIADIDFISEQFFEIRKQGVGGLNFDNVSFFLNSMDMVMGDDSFIALRSRRVQHRTLERVEGNIQNFVEERSADEQKAESEAQVALQNAQQRLEERVAEVQQRTDVDNQTKRIMSTNIREAEQRKFDALKQNIEAERDAKIADSKERMESQIRAIQSRIKTLAVLIPPIPVIIIGMMIFMRRRKREEDSVSSARRLRS